MSDYTKGEQKKCNKHGYYWVGLCCNGQIANDICPGCLIAAAPDLLEACKRDAGLADAAIMLTPTGEYRNKLTEINILRLQAITKAKKG